MRKHSQRPGHHQDEVIIRLHIEEGPQDLDRPTGHRHRQRLHPGGATKPHRRIVDHSPTGGIDLHRPPGRVAEVEVEPVVQSTDADMDDALRRVEMRLRLDHVERRLQRLGTRRALRRLEEAARQPAAEALGADRPGLPVAVDVEIGEAGSVGRMEQFGRLREVDQDIGLRRAAPANITAFLGDGLVERRHPAARTLQLSAQCLERGAVVFLQRGKPLQQSPA